MRVLVTFTGGTGHFLPTLPYARELLTRGHEVRYACQLAMVGVVEQAGFPAVDTGGATLLAADDRRPLVPVDRAHEQRVVADFFVAQVGAERAQRTAALISSWRPDLLLRDEMDVGAGVAAEAAGLFSADVVVTAAGGFVDAGLIGPSLEELRARHGLPTDGALAGLHGDLTLEPVPPGLRDPADPLPPTAVPVRPPILDEAAALRAAAPARARPRRSVYLTLGTVFPQESGDLFARVLAGLAVLDVDVLVTVGRECETAELGPQPANVRVEQFVPVAAALAGRDLVISHAGSGTVIATLALGLPSLLLPLGADQPWTADRCAALGVSRVLDPVICTPAQVTATVLDLLGDEAAKRRARTLAQRAAALPTTAEATDLLERVTG
jgi:UDP:flavonoid glycosyltransferase YjiC (YdhE family)